MGCGHEFGILTAYDDTTIAFALFGTFEGVTWKANKHERELSIERRNRASY